MAGRYMSRVLTRSILAVSGASSGVGPVRVSRQAQTTRGLRGVELDVGLDYKHWLITIKQPEGHLSRDEIIDIYIKMLASVVGSEEEARMKLYSVSTRFYFGFGALISQDLSSKFKDFPNVIGVLPDCYSNSITKDYGGEPFIDGQPVPYDPKYHSSCITVRNHWKGIDIDLDDDTEEITDTEVEIPDTDAAGTATADEIPHTDAAATAGTH